jgi:hypothetical protein
VIAGRKLREVPIAAAIDLRRGRSTGAGQASEHHRQVHRLLSLRAHAKERTNQELGAGSPLGDTVTVRSVSASAVSCSYFGRAGGDVPLGFWPV